MDAVGRLRQGDPYRSNRTVGARRDGQDLVVVTRPVTILEQAARRPETRPPLGLVFWRSLLCLDRRQRARVQRMRYFFDMRDGDTLGSDLDGLELENFEDVKRAAAKGLAEFAGQLLTGSEGRTLATEVRDETGRKVLVAVMLFEVRFLHG
jgi:hypothetical protein